LLWLLANSGDETDVRALAALLEDSNETVQSLSAYGLRHLAVKRKLPASVLATLKQVAQRSGDGLPPVYVESAAFVTARDAATRKQLGELLVTRLASSEPGAKYEILSGFAVAGGPNELPTAISMLDDADPDVRIAAANAVLRIDRRKPLPFQPIDWLVLVGYAGLMIGIGVYYERRSKTTDDYLLGGRTMRPWAVGLSYYATLFSTISYLAYPSEMIQNGPLILSAILGYPFIYLVVSRLLIPFIMTLPVTSAYEILEKRLGLSVRMLGSTFFLLLRLMWMSVIIYATADTILVPLLRLDSSATPYVCLGLGTLTVVYTSLGGLRAVIWTDVAQLLILFSGAILSILFVTYYMGGVGAWLPREWDPNWETPRLWFDPTARVTIASAILSSFVWYVCTAGSDQMAIQRYLATRDKRSAQRMFKISLVSDASVAILLAILGLALHAYFRAHPQMLPDGETLATGADRLLPQFIVKGLPMGITGLVIAGLLSAAMSSLSSGLNSTCTVITVDWIDRFRKIKLRDAEHMQLAKRVSWLLGTAIVALSMFAGTVEGNLMEVSNKLVNLLTAPLFVLFFMAMFVPWATTFGTWMAAIASVAMAVAISHFELGGLSFLWIMPMSLVAGVFVGCLASFAPIGKPRPMLKVKQ
jgi:SSS family solute:Na+ symporter